MALGCSPKPSPPPAAVAGEAAVTPDPGDEEDVQLLDPGVEPRRLLRLDAARGTREEWLVTYDETLDTDGRTVVVASARPVSTLLLDLELEEVDGGERVYDLRVGLAPTATRTGFFAQGTLVVDERGRALDYTLEYVLQRSDGELVPVEAPPHTTETRGLSLLPTLLVPMPREAVGVGAEWTLTESVPLAEEGLALTAKSSYRLVALRPDTADVRVRLSSHTAGNGESVRAMSLNQERTISLGSSRVLSPQRTSELARVDTQDGETLRITKSTHLRPLEERWFGVIPVIETLSFTFFDRPAWCLSLRGPRQGRFPTPAGPARLVGECEAGTPVGIWTSYHEDRQTKRIEGRFESGLPMGRWTQYGVDGSPLGSFELDAGTGTVTEWWPDGGKRFEIGLRSGLPDGPFTTWHANGKVQLRGQFHRGQRDGQWEALDPAGAQIGTATHDHGCRVVRDVLEDSPAARGGLRDDDIVVRVGKTDVGSQKEVGEAVARVGDRTVRVVVLRDGKRVSLKVEPEHGRLGISMTCGVVRSS